MNIVGKVITAVASIAVLIIVISLIYSPFLQIGQSLNESSPSQESHQYITDAMLVLGIAMVIPIVGVIAWLFVSMHQNEYEESWRWR